MRRQSWIKKEHVAKRHAVARNVYELRGRYSGGAGCHEGSAVVVAAPGPSFGSFPRDALALAPSIGVNAALELFEPTYWLYAEPVLTRIYRKLYLARRSAIVTTRWQAIGALEHVLPEARRLYWFRYGHSPRHDPEDRRDAIDPKSAGLSVLKMARPTDGRTPWWSLPAVGFLPGRCSVATHAVSLAILMGARVVVTVGVDFRFQGDGYYSPGVTINPGPGKGVATGLVLGKRRTKALACGRNWAALAAAKGVWSEAEVLTVSPAGGLPGARRVTVDEAVGILRG